MVCQEMLSHQKTSLIGNYGCRKDIGTAVTSGNEILREFILWQQPRDYNACLFICFLGQALLTCIIAFPVLFGQVWV